MRRNVSSARDRESRSRVQSVSIVDAVAGLATFVGLWSVASVLLTVGWVVERKSGGEPLFADDEGDA